MSFDYDDDIRRDETDELHGIAGGWYDKDPTPTNPFTRARLAREAAERRAHGLERPVASATERSAARGVQS